MTIAEKNAKIMEMGKKGSENWSPEEWKFAEMLKKERECRKC